MKKVIVLFTSIMMVVSLQAQTMLYPPRILNIQKKGEIYMKLESPSTGFKRDSYDWESLLMDFQENLQSIISEVPTYNIYSINYTKGISMRIEDVNDVVRYKVEGNRTTTAARQSTATLRDNDFAITLYFSQLEDLFSEEYQYMITDAMAKWRKMAKFWGTDFTYSYTEGKMVKGYEPYPLGRRITAVVSPSIGIYKNQPIYELSTGLGVSFGRERQHLFYLFVSQVYQYQEEVSISDRINSLGGIAVKYALFGAHIAFPLDEENPFRQDYHFRYGITFYPIRNLTINTHVFYTKENDNGTLYGFSVGYGF